MNETIFDRISTVVEKFGNGKNTVFASLIGVSEANVRNYKNGVMPKADFLEKIARSFDININWLLTGEGNMLYSESEKKENIPVAHPSDSPMEGIPLIPISAMAGAFTGEQTVLEYECERFVVPTFKGAEFLISVKGSSMYPKYNSGDIVACKRLPMDDIFFQWNKVYVLDTDQGPLIKRVKPGSDKEHVLIVSDNERYEPFELPLNRIYHVALVIGVIRLE
jgi:phage repressor protein C with HTH and peptisase S24 domain